MPRRERARLATGSATPSAMTTSAPSTSTTTSSGGVMLTMAALAAVGASSLAADATVLGEGPSSLLSVGNRRFSTCRCEGAAAVATNCDAIAFSTGTTGDHELCSSLPSEWRERKSVGRCRRVCRNAEQKEEERWGWNKLQKRGARVNAALAFAPSAACSRTRRTFREFSRSSFAAAAADVTAITPRERHHYSRNSLTRRGRRPLTPPTPPLRPAGSLSCSTLSGATVSDGADLGEAPGRGGRAAGGACSGRGLVSTALGAKAKAGAGETVRSPVPEPPLLFVPKLSEAFPAPSPLPASSTTGPAAKKNEVEDGTQYGVGGKAGAVGAVGVPKGNPRVKPPATASRPDSAPRVEREGFELGSGRRFVGTEGRGSGRPRGVRSGGVLAPVLRPLLDALDGARGHAAIGAAAMEVLEVVERVRWDGIKFSALRLGKVVAGAAVAGKWGSHGRPLVERMESVGVPSREVRSWTAVLLPLSRLGCADACLEVLAMMESVLGVEHAVPNGSGDRDRQHSRADSRRVLLGRQEALLTVAHNHCMYAYIKAGRHEEAVAHFNYYFRRSIYPADEMFLAPDADTGGTKTGEDIDQPPGFQGASLLGSWRESLLPPDTFSYTHLMTALEKLGRERACLSAIHEMRARGVKADTYCYVSAMKALGAAGLWEAAVSLLQELRDLEGVAPDVYVYTAAISACSTAGRWEEALSLEGDMRRRGIKPNAYTVTSCISALARGGEWERAVQELEAAEEDDLPVSTPAFNAALKAFAIAKALKPGLDFFRRMQEEGRIPLDEQTYNIAIELCKECGDTSKALGILRTMSAAGFPPSVVSFNTALGACETSGNYRLSLELLGEMRQLSRTPGGAIAPDVLSYNAALGTCARAGQWDEVTALLREMDETLRGDENPISSRNFITFATLIMTADAIGEPRRCLEFYAEMGKWGLAPNVPVYEAVARACLGSRAWRWATLVHRDATSRQSASEWTAAAAAVAMMATGHTAYASTILMLDSGGSAGRGLAEDADGEGGSDSDSELDSTLTAAARCAMKAMLDAGDAAAASALFEAFLEVAEPGVQLRVMYVRARVALARSDESSPNENASALGGIVETPVEENRWKEEGGKMNHSSELVSEYTPIWNDTMTLSPGDVYTVSPAKDDDLSSPGDETLTSLSEDEALTSCLESSSIVTLPSLPGDDILTSPFGDDSLSPSNGDDTLTSPPEDDAMKPPPWDDCLTSPSGAGPALASLRALRKLEELGLDPGEKEHAAALWATLDAAAGGCGAALAVLRRLGAKGLICDQRAGAAVLLALSRRKDWAGAAAVADELAGLGNRDLFNHTSYSATAAITAYGRANRWKDAVQLLETLVDGGDSASPVQVASTVVFNAGIMACSRAGQLEEGMRLLGEMRHRGVPRDVQTYNTAMALCKGAGEWTRAVGLLEAMGSERIAPDTVTFNTVIAACEAGADHWTAFSLFNQMERAGLTPDVWTYNSLANVLGSCGEWERALGLLDDMRLRGLTPDVITYSALVSACQKAGQVEASLRLLEEMSSNGIEANEKTLSAAIKAVSSWSRTPPSESSLEDKLRQVARLHKQAKERGVANVVTYSAAINACARQKRWREALGLLYEMRRDGIKPNDYSYSAAMWACVNADQGKRALQLFDVIMDAPINGRGFRTPSHDQRQRHLSEAPWSPEANMAVAEAAVGEGSISEDYGEEARVKDGDRGEGCGGGLGRSLDCYMAAVTACQKEGDFSRALSLLQHMRNKGVRGSLGLYNLVLSMCQSYGDADTSKRLLTMMRLDKVAPSVVSCNQVIAACEKAGRWEDALSILGAMMSGGLRPNVQTVCSTLRACCLGHSPQRAVRLLDELGETMGSALALPVYNTLISSFHREGRYDLADFFYKQAYQEGIVTHWQQQQDRTGLGGATNSLSPEGRNDGRIGVETGVMDLHGFSLPLAHAAVRCALEEVWRFSQRQRATTGDRDLTIITGVGKGSLHAYQPVVRPEVQRMLIDEFYPPIHSATEVGNAGRVVVGAVAIKAWLDHNMEAKRPAMARLAAALDKRARPAAMARLAAVLKQRTESGSSMGAKDVTRQEADEEPEEQQEYDAAAGDEAGRRIPHSSGLPAPRTEGGVEVMTPLAERHLASIAFPRQGSGRRVLTTAGGRGGSAASRVVLPPDVGRRLMGRVNDDRVLPPRRS